MLFTTVTVFDISCWLVDRGGPAAQLGMQGDNVTIFSAFGSLIWPFYVSVGHTHVESTISISLPRIWDVITSVDAVQSQQHDKLLHQTID